MQGRPTFLMEWLRDSRWREHVVVAARCVDPGALRTFQGQIRQSIAAKPRAAALQAPDSGGELLPAAGGIATFGTP